MTAIIGVVGGGGGGGGEYLSQGKWRQRFVIAQGNKTRRITFYFCISFYMKSKKDFPNVKSSNQVNDFTHK